jgi:hypothetical protein
MVMVCRYRMSHVLNTVLSQVCEGDTPMLPPPNEA